MSEHYYGEPPESVSKIELPQFQEFMHYLYLPVRLPGGYQLHMPENLWAADVDELVWQATEDFGTTLDHYVYVTARRGMATPGNPLNRPGWHCDGFGTDDINYVWCDRYPTVWLDRPISPRLVSDSHLESQEQFNDFARVFPEDLKEIECNVLTRLNPYVIHHVPEIPAPGGMRSFVKVSISRHKYNLIGNSHNHLISYDWKMYPRDINRNDPARAGTDFYE